MPTRGRWVSSDKRKFGVKDCSLIFHISRRSFCLVLRVRIYCAGARFLLTDIIRGSPEDDRSSGTRNGDAHGAQ